MEASILAELGGIGQVAPISLLVGAMVGGLWLFYRSIMKGDLVPGKTLEASRTSEKEWRELAIVRLDEQGKQLKALLDSGETATGLIRAIQSLAREREQP